MTLWISRNGDIPEQGGIKGRLESGVLVMWAGRRYIGATVENDSELLDAVNDCGSKHVFDEVAIIDDNIDGRLWDRPFKIVGSTLIDYSQRRYKLGGAR